MDSYLPTFKRLLGTRLNLPSWWPLSTTVEQSRGLARILTVAIEENLPLVPLLESWAEDERGTQKGRIRRLVERLRSGRPLPDALEDIPGILHDDEVLALRFDAQSGTRAAALRQLLAASDPRDTHHSSRARRTRWYLAIMLPLLLFCFLWLNIRIVPVFLRMFYEFGLSTVPSLHWSSIVTGVIQRFWWLVGLGMVALIGVLVSTSAGRRLQNSLLARWLLLPAQRQAALILGQLAVAASAGRPISGALSTLARYHPTASVRHQLLFARNEVEQGANVWESLADAGLLSPSEVYLLTTADRLGNRSWVLETLAKTKRRLAHWRIVRRSELILPAVVLFLGLLVLLVALVIFQPLVQLIDSLA